MKFVQRNDLHFAKIPLARRITPPAKFFNRLAQKKRQPTSNEEEIAWAGWWGMRL